MKNKKILHLCYIEKFIPSFVELVRNKVKTNIHTFVTIGSNYEKYPIKEGSDLTFLSGRYLRYFTITKKMNEAEEIILHGLFDPGIIILLFLQPWLLKKCYWVMWGGDIYSLPKRGLFNSFVEFSKQRIAKRMGYLVTYVKGDVEHVRARYGAQGKYKYCIMYPSNLYKEVQYKDESTTTINIQIGNSADSENEHVYILEKLRNSPLENMRIFAPLSYGDKVYAKKISKLGIEYFGDVFNVMCDFMNLTDYTQWQSSIDIAIFAHKRQQGMGNIITLLGLGKSVYMRSGVSSTLALENLGILVGKIGEDEIKILPSCGTENNIKIVRDKFSEKALVQQLSDMFN